MQSSIAKERLCEKCCNILNECLSPFTSKDYINIDHYKLVADIRASADEGCRGCRIFWIHISCAGRGGVTNYNTLSTGGYLLDNKRPNFLFNVELKSTVTSESTRLPWLEFCVTLLSEPRSCQELPPILQLANENLDGEVKALMQRTTKHWMDSCNQNHEKCQRAQLLTKRFYTIPTRLIDVQSGDENTVRLIDTKEELAGNTQPDYLILSYCWGVGNDTAKTTRSNLHQRKRQIIVCNLPKTIRDAIFVTRAMGVRYLWADALCIIQPDNDGFLDDWNSEAAQMGSYYSNALFCISALCASDSSAGFLRERHSARYPWREEEYVEHGGKLFSLQPPEEITKPNIMRTPLMQRAWALQERILSTRRLHWSVVGLLWECDSGLFRENNPLVDVRPDYYERYGYLTTDNLSSQILSLPKVEALEKAWLGIVYQYSKMKLTNPTDRLAAIHGVARRLSLQHNVEYFGGIFSAYCSTALTWKRWGPGSEQVDQEDFPSWSWATVESFWFESSHLSGKDSSRIKGFARCADPGKFPSLDEVVDFTDRSKRILWLKAPVVPISFQEGNPAQQNDSAWDVMCERSEGPIWLGQAVDISMDCLNRSSIPLTVTLLICAGEYPREGMTTVEKTEVKYMGLVLKRSEKDGRDAYARLGYFDVSVPWSQTEEEGSYLDNWITDVNLF